MQELLLKYPSNTGTVGFYFKDFAGNGPVYSKFRTFCVVKVQRESNFVLTKYIMNVEHFVRGIGKPIKDFMIRPLVSYMINCQIRVSA
jgi:hypothetical protein